MSFSGGVFSINTSGQPVVAGTTISASVFNALTADLATGLSTCMLKDGTQTATAGIGFYAGTVSLPGIYFGTETSTGLYRIGANNTGYAVSGAKVLDIASTGLGVTGTLSSTGNFTVATNVFTVSATALANAFDIATSTGAITSKTSASAVYAHNFQNVSGSPLGIYYQFTGAAPNGTGNSFLYCEDNAAGGTLRAQIRSNGGLANFSANNVNLSDERLKKEFQPAPSYYDRWTKIEFLTYLYKDQSDGELNLGVKAQQLEKVCPELVDVSGFGKAPDGEGPYKAIYQTDFQYATAKALQEAIIELEALKADFQFYKLAH